MSLTPKQQYTENKIRAGYSSIDVGIWQALCRQCEMEAGHSIKHMRTILELADHCGGDVLDMISSGRTLSGQKSVNEKFMAALINSMAEVDECAEAPPDIDLTANEELSSSGSYEETSEPGSGSRLNSAECYEIDGFVVEDNDDDIDRAADEIVAAASSSRRGFEEIGQVKNGKKRLIKRKLSIIDEEAEEE